MGIDWSAFEGGDWQRVRGDKARRYVNKKTGVVISRRQFLQHYGKAQAFGTLEKRAKYYSKSDKQLLRPARGRKSALRVIESEKTAIAARRRLERQEKAADKKIEKELKRKRRTPKKISVSNFKKGKISRNIELDVDYSEIERVRLEAKKSGIVFGYLVGANMITEMGEDRTFTTIKLRSISKSFKREEFDSMLETVQQMSYATLVSLFVHLSLSIDVARKRNNWKGGHKK